MPTLRELLDAPNTTLAELQKHLASLDAQGRITETRQLGKKQQRRLYGLAAESEPLTADFMVSGVPDGEVVRWYGRNTLPAFRLFEKRFRRFQGAVVGINVQPSIQFVTGPGYFTCRIDESRPRDLLIDYTQVPAAQPPEWPVVKSNKAGLSIFIYHNMYDYCRKVSETVVIGEATRLGKPINNYFTLCRG